MTHMHCMCIRVVVRLLLRCLRRQVRVQGRCEVSGGPEPIFDLLTDSVPTSSTHERGGAFFQYLQSPRAQDIFEKHGFIFQGQ